MSPRRDDAERIVDALEAFVVSLVLDMRSDDVRDRLTRGMARDRLVEAIAQELDNEGGEDW